MRYYVTMVDGVPDLNSLVMRGDAGFGPVDGSVELSKEEYDVLYIQAVEMRSRPPVPPVVPEEPPPEEEE